MESPEHRTDLILELLSHCTCQLDATESKSQINCGFTEKQSCVKDPSPRVSPHLSANTGVLSSHKILQLKRIITGKDETQFCDSAQNLLIDVATGEIYVKLPWRAGLILIKG